MQKFQADDYQQSLPTKDGKFFIECLKHADASVEIYAPKKIDNQQPHTQDEIYCIIAGNGKFQCGDETTDFKSGDLLFVPAKIPHYFFDFSDDFQTWVIFFGKIHN